MLALGLYLGVLLYWRPYVRAVDDRLQLLAQSYLLLILIMGWILSVTVGSTTQNPNNMNSARQQNTLTAGTAEDILLSMVMLAVVAALFLLLLYHLVLHVRKAVRARQREELQRREQESKGAKFVKLPSKLDLSSVRSSSPSVSGQQTGTSPSHRALLAAGGSPRHFDSGANGVNGVNGVNGTSSPVNGHGHSRTPSNSSGMRDELQLSPQRRTIYAAMDRAAHNRKPSQPSELELNSMTVSMQIVDLAPPSSDSVSAQPVTAPPS